MVNASDEVSGSATNDGHPIIERNFSKATGTTTTGPGPHRSINQRSSQRGLTRSQKEWEAKQKARVDMVRASSTAATNRSNETAAANKSSKFSSIHTPVGGEYHPNATTTAPATSNELTGKENVAATSTEATTGGEELTILDVVKARASDSNEIEDMESLKKKEAAARAIAADHKSTNPPHKTNKLVGDGHQKATATAEPGAVAVPGAGSSQVSSQHKSHQQVLSKQLEDVMDVVQQRAFMAGNHEEEEPSKPTLEPSNPPHSIRSMPGAYSGAPGEGLTRREGFCSSSLFGIQERRKPNDIEEGFTSLLAPPQSAIAQSPRVALENDEGIALGQVGGGEGLDWSGTDINNVLPARNDSDNLVMARPVEPEEDRDGKEMQQASQYDMEAAKERKQEHSKKTWRWFVGLLVLVLGAVLVIIFATGSHMKDAGELIPTISSSPTLSPSGAPSTQEEKLLRLLPEATVEAIRKATTTEKESPQVLAFQWLMDDPNMMEYSDMRLVQRFALATFHFSTGGPMYWYKYIAESWLDYALHECKWGFTHSKFLGELNDTRVETGEAANDELWFKPPEFPCELYNTTNTNLTGPEDDQHYTSLWVPGANLVGEIPPETFLLTSLRFMNTQQNLEVGGTLPTEIGLLSSLEGLNLGRRMELGPLPSEIGRCTNLEVLRTHNATGTFPTELGLIQELQYFDAEGAQLTGSLPSEIGLLKKLEVLYLEGNGFTGPIPQEFTHMTSLVTVQMQWNSLTGTIPTGIRNLTNLLLFDVYANQLTGRIPSEIGMMTQLTDLWLHINQLTGGIPSQLGNLDMFIFPAFKNQLTGSIPSELGRWTNIFYFVIQENKFSGSLPSELGLMTDVRTFRLEENRLNGPMPSEFGQFSEVNYFYLRNNGITGTIPTELGMLESVDNIYLSSMELTGTIPSQLGMLPSIKKLWLNDNNLVGTVPLELGELNSTKLEMLHLQNNSLSGTVPDEVCRQSETAEFLFDCYERLCGCSSCACSSLTADATISSVTSNP